MGILGVLFGGKRYPLLKYLFVFLIVAGVALFTYKDKSGGSDSGMSIGVGEILLLVSLTCGELFDFLGFVAKHPDILWHLFLASGAMALGQHFIFMCISEFGPLPCSIITTTRKCFTVLFSVIFFGNALTGQQWMGASLVFLGLFLDGNYGKSHKS